jgi:hypothetical protein
MDRYRGAACQGRASKRSGRAAGMKGGGILAICLVLWASAGTRTGTSASHSDAPYDPDPQHLWNRLYDALFVRTEPGDGERYGSAELDILFWDSTKHLLTSPSREKAIQVLDEFIRSHGERLIRDPMKRALLQRDLWALFDWSAAHLARRESSASASQPEAELQRRLVAVISRLALSAGDIGRLPDNFAEAELRLDGSGFPHGLFASDSACLDSGCWQHFRCATECSGGDRVPDGPDAFTCAASGGGG